MKTYGFEVVVEPDENAQGGATLGQTGEDALSNISEVVHMIVQEFIDDGKPLA
jgi:predicted RNase H-like HicB family nuclease